MKKIKQHTRRKWLGMGLMGLVFSFCAIQTTSAQDKLQFFPQLVVAQDDAQPPTGGRRLHGPTADKIKRLTRKDHAFEINALARKPVTVSLRKVERVTLSSDVIMELELISSRALSVKIYDAKTRKVLKSQSLTTNIDQQVIIGPDSSEQVVIILNKGDKRPR